MKSQVGVHRKGELSLLDILKGVKNEPSFNKAGAVAMFIGVVRGEGAENKKVYKLELEAYEEKANEVLLTICNDLKKKPGIVDVQIHHLLGEFNVGEDIVYVLVAGSHRDNVFPVLKEAVERYKREAPIFKKEYLIDEEGEITACWVSEEEGN
ncbi:MAG: molybdenum cofactor biosynthesis protein MoaE [Candidatus Bathyarchaeia archaeon]